MNYIFGEHSGKKALLQAGSQALRLKRLSCILKDSESQTNKRLDIAQDWKPTDADALRAIPA